MGKVIVPQELQEMIIHEYVDNKKGIRTIKRQLKLSYSPQKIKEVLIENNIHIRNVNEGNHAKSKYTVNDNYDFNSHNGAWLLGLLASDGYLPCTYGAKNKIVLTLQRRDEDTLQMIKEELNYTGPIYQFESSNGHECSSLSISSKVLRKKVESYGIVNAKTFKFKHLPKNLPREYMIDFIRGYFDGDGSVIVLPKEKKINMSITAANQELLEEIIHFLEQEYAIPKCTIREQMRKHKVYELRYYKASSLLLGSLFYDNNYMSLIRKKNHFLQAREEFPILRK